MERNLKPTGLVNLLIALAAAGLGTYIARSTASYADEVVSVFLGLGFLVALFSYFQMRMEAREKLEKLELDELAKSARSTTLFDGTDAEAFPARRAREQFERWLVPAFCLVLLVLQVAAAWWLGKQVLNPDAREVRNSLPMMAAFFGFLFFLQFLPGRYSVNVARLEGQRLLQPAGSYLLLGAYLSLLAAAGIVAIHFGHSKVDIFIARALCVILALAAVENLFTLILEIYRPRVRGQAARVLYESRLVGLLGQPESVFTTAAHALDYQFGFKVSETWFFQFLQKAFVWLLLIQSGLLWLSTSFVFIEPDEQALLERIATREVVRHLVSVDFFEFMSVGRKKSAEALRANIQKSADDAQLGVDILFVGLQDVHPPVSVAEAFEAVIGAQQTREAKTLAAKGEATKSTAMAEGEAQKVKDTAAAFAVRRVAEAGAIGAQFEHQMAAFDAAPTVYPQRIYLQTYAKAIAKSRKYIIATTNAQEMIQLNLEDKIREDLLNLEIPAKK